MTKLCGRPDDFTERIVDNCKAMIKPEDILIHLGDVTWTGMDELQQIPASRKILVKGNHDKRSYSWYMSHGFDFACEQFIWKTGGLNIVFSHKPLIFHEYDVNIHGHLHDLSTSDSGDYHYALAMEHEYKPIKLSDILPRIRKEVERRGKEELLYQQSEYEIWGEEYDEIKGITHEGVY